MVIFGGRSFWEVIRSQGCSLHECNQCPYKKDPLFEVIVRKQLVCKPGRGFSPDPDSVGALTLDFPLNNYKQYISVVNKLPSLWHSVTAACTDQDGFHGVHCFCINFYLWFLVWGFHTVEREWLGEPGSPSVQWFRLGTPNSWDTLPSEAGAGCCFRAICRGWQAEFLIRQTFLAPCYQEPQIPSPWT